MKILSGAELAGFVKERQAAVVRSLRGQRVQPRLLILRDSDNPVITKYVGLKARYGADIGVEVIDRKVATAELPAEITQANADPAISGMIVQLPLVDPTQTDAVVRGIAAAKDMDGLAGGGKFDSATATAINWLLTGYDVPLAGRKIAIVGQGRLVGGPLLQMWRASGLDVTAFTKQDDLTNLAKYDTIVSATGVPHLIKTEVVKPGAVLVDAGTASEDGVLVGDIDDAVRQRTDLAAITPKVGGVGPLTVAVLFENVITAAKNA